MKSCNLYRKISPKCVWFEGFKLLRALRVRYLIAFLKAGSQSDARPGVALIRETHKFITKKVGDFLTTRHKNATQGSARIGSESILALYCVSTSVDAKATQRNALICVVL